MSYDATPAPAGADPEKWAAHEAGSCGGYYRCAFCAEIISRPKSIEAEAREVGTHDGRTRRTAPRQPTQTDEAAARSREARRAKAKAARKARKVQRRRVR